MRGRLAGIILISLAAAAAARDPEGALALIRSPHNGAPAIVQPGGAFTVSLAEQAGIRLVGEQNELE
ncbi:MAG: hypothetical protein JXR94_19990, partial [Candidatus Hydrogenedentes bacterium]|nr:hypothetical protein [Candidatus Hydrogenedentota bacterium]